MNNPVIHENAHKAEMDDYARREAGADSCDQMLPVNVFTTFKA